MKTGRSLDGIECRLVETSFSVKATARPEAGQDNIATGEAKEALASGSASLVSASNARPWRAPGAARSIGDALVASHPD